MMTLGSITLQGVWSMPWIMFVFQVKWAQMISWVKHLTQKSWNRENRNANYKFTKEKLEVTGYCGLPKVLQSLGLFRELRCLDPCLDTRPSSMVLAFCLSPPVQTGRCWRQDARPPFAGYTAPFPGTDHLTALSQTHFSAPPSPASVYNFYGVCIFEISVNQGHLSC